MDSFMVKLVGTSTFVLWLLIVLLSGCSSNEADQPADAADTQEPAPSANAQGDSAEPTNTAKSKAGREPAAREQATDVLRGKLTYVDAQGRESPDAGSVVILLPVDQRPSPGERISPIGLRPDEPISDGNPRLKQIRALGGAYTRTDVDGAYRLRVPRRGCYMMLVISGNMKRDADARLNKEDLARLGRYVAASDLAGAFAEIVAEAVEAARGTLLEIRGDEALAVFDSARDALAIAVELQEAFADERRRHPELPLDVGIGLDAGEAVPHDGGYRGAALNLAARLSAVSAGGEVHASSAIVHLAGRTPDVVFGPARELSLKGTDEPVSAHLVHARDADSSAASHAASSVPPTDHPSAEPLAAELDALVPLAGREPEMRWLRWHWRRAGHGHGRTLAISGPQASASPASPRSWRTSLMRTGRSCATRPAYEGPPRPMTSVRPARR